MENKQLIEKLHDLTRSAEIKIKENTNSKELKHVDVALAGLYQRMINGLDSVEFLVKGDYHLEAMIIMRSMIENTIVINSLLSKPNETMELLDKLTNFNFKKINKVVLKHPDFKDSTQKFDFSKLESELVGVGKISDLSPANKELYEISYKILCNDVHINLKSINDFLISDKENNFEVLNKPKNNNFENAYYTIFYCFSLIYKGFSGKYNIIIDEATEIDRLIENLL